MDADNARRRFTELHAAPELFVMPNAFDVGSAQRLAAAGFPALATTSSGFAWSIGKHDQEVTFDELVPHVAAICAAVDVPVSVDSERLYAESAEGIAPYVEALAEAGAAGCSIEDYDPATGEIDPIGVATERVAAAAEAAHRGAVPMVLTARCENLLYGVDDLDDVVRRLIAYRDAGADCVYAPGLVDLGQIAAVVASVKVPVNVLARPGGPTVAELTTVGVRRVSTGGRLTAAAYDAAVDLANSL